MKGVINLSFSYSRDMFTDRLTIKYTWPVIVQACEKVKLNADKAKTKTNRKDVDVGGSRKMEEILLVSPVIDTYRSLSENDEDEYNVDVLGEIRNVDGKLFKFIKALTVNTTSANEEFATVVFDVMKDTFQQVYHNVPCLQIRRKEGYSDFQNLVLDELQEFYLKEVL